MDIIDKSYYRDITDENIRSKFISYSVDVTLKVYEVESMSVLKNMKKCHYQSQRISKC